jgi:hypothetical protein
MTASSIHFFRFQKDRVPSALNSTRDSDSDVNPPFGEFWLTPTGLFDEKKMAKLQEKKILEPKPNRLMAKNVADRNTAHGMRNTACGAIKKRLGFF